MADRARMVELAEMALVDELFGHFGLGQIEVAGLDVQHLAGGPCRLEHGLRIHIRTGHGLFAVDVFARFQRGHGDGHVEVVVQADVDRVDIVPFQQLAKIGVDMGDVVQVGYTPAFGLVQVGQRHQFGVGEFAVGLHVLLPDLADTDEPDAYLLRTHVLLRSKRLRDPILRRSWAHR